MDLCCTLVIGIGLLSCVIWIMGAISDANAKRQEEIKRAINTFESIKQRFLNNENAVKNGIKSFFAQSTGSYMNEYDSMTTWISAMQDGIQEMNRGNNTLTMYARNEDRSAVIQTLKNTTIPETQRIAAGFLAFCKKNGAFPAVFMIDEDSYGKINKTYWDEITSMDRNDAVDYIRRCDSLLGSNDFNNLYDIALSKVLKCVWFFATEKTFSASDFQKAQNVFSRIYKNSHADVIIADLYAKKKMGGEDVLRETIRDLLKIEQDSKKLTRIASALMWMNAYQSENTVLQHMLTSGKEMTAKTQERLHSLTNGGGKAPSGFEVKSGINELYFDVSALAWKDDEYVGLFENLAFQDKTLTYSLALREENKDLFIPQGIQVPGAEEVLNKLNAVFSEEYGSGVTARVVNCIALSGSGEERMDGILASSGECRQMGILIHIARIGKKLIIKFYTLFTPTGNDLAAQKQQALSMFKKLSPTVTMWEGSLKDTMLMAVEQLLNTSAQSAPSSASAASPDETVF